MKSKSSKNKEKTVEEERETCSEGFLKGKAKTIE